ncbi:SCO-spondin-like [Paramacrobiotus metropolitanus]|uniref:SCO-spondin-like n=1 Tax=Paramacrobiotus metropolitanus TaxID=2943436 RepID=UPI0024459505|nr:SCO-spondin-like [Paramacrobiotus metropolitanus]
MIIRKFWISCVILSSCTPCSRAQDEDVVGTVNIKIQNLTSPDGGDDLYADEDLYTSTKLPPLMKQGERESPPLVNRSSTGILQVDGDHKIGTCPPAYAIAIGSCLDTCKSDADCPGKWKCCKNECGKNICSSPIQDFGWYHWGQWGSCTASCGGGVRVRNRNCNFPGRLAEQKKYCHGNHYELESCNSQKCESYVSPWMEWTSWTACSAKCGGGVRSRYRFRVCADEDSSEKIFCDDFQMDLEECNYHSCADVVYSNWSSWSACSSSCGTGLMSRFRSCPFCPFTGYVGECSGPNFDYKVCTGPPCKGEQRLVEDWSDWSRCTRDCDSGLKISVRKNPECQLGKDCEGYEFRSDICNPQKCPVIPGDYGQWSDWSECSADGCEEGYQYASRDCNHPTPWNSGRYCSGKPFELRVCNFCKMVDGGWSDWGKWSECSASCGGGLRYKSRSCDNPTPMYGGRYCPGDHFKLEACNTVSCSASEGYEWGCWSPCSRKCGGGGRIRYGTCNAPTQQRYDEICNADPYEDEACNTDACDDQEVDAKLSSWTPWSSCSHTCGTGTRIRYKYSLCPAGKDSDACHGHDFEIERCQTRPCSKKALAWDHWSSWSPCSSLCGGGSTMRIRKCLSHGIDQHLVCPGTPYDVQPCNTHPCDHYRQDYAAWSSWSLPTPCSGQCSEDGYFANTFRIFSCGSADVEDCPRIEIRQVECDYRSCYKDVNNFIYPPWSEWSSCSKPCGTGYGYRNRTFADDLPVNGEFCTKPAFEVAQCNRKKCGLREKTEFAGDWSSWSSCSRSCGGGIQMRRRQCMIVSVPEYTDSVVIPPPRPQPRSACLDGSSDFLSGIELAGCAISLCPGELQRFDAQYDNKDNYNYANEASTPRYPAAADLVEYNSTAYPDKGANRLKLDHLEQDDHDEHYPKYPTAATTISPTQYVSSNSSSYRQTVSQYQPAPASVYVPSYQGWNTNVNTLYPNRSIVPPFPAYQGYDFVNATGHLLRYPQVNPGVQTLVYNLPLPGDFRVQRPPEYGPRNVSAPYVQPGQPMQGWGSVPPGAKPYNVSRLQGALQYNQSAVYVNQIVSSGPQQYGPPVGTPPQGWGPVTTLPPQGWGTTSPYGYDRQSAKLSYGTTAGWGPLSTFTGWSSTTPKPQGWGTTSTVPPQGWGPSSTLGYQTTSGWGTTPYGLKGGIVVAQNTSYVEYKPEKLYLAPTTYQGWGPAVALSTPAVSGWGLVAESRPYPNVSFALDLSKGFVGGWSEWGPWSGCTKSCNGGQRFKIRVCAASENRKECIGPDRRNDACNKQACSGTPACVKQCKGDNDCGSNSKCCTPDGCNSVCIGGSDCNFDPAAPCTQATCRPGFECISWVQPNCPYPPCEPVPKCICPLSCPSGYRKHPLTGETMCACNSACEAINCKPRQRCVPLDRLCQSCPSVGLCLDEGCFLLQLYDKMVENGIGSASSIYVVPPNANSPPMPGRNYSQMALPGQNYTGRNSYSRGAPKPLPLAYGATRPVEILKVPQMPVASNPPAASKVLPAPLPDVRPQNSYPERPANVPKVDPVLMQRYRESVSADYDDYDEDTRKIPY